MRRILSRIGAMCGLAAMVSLLMVGIGSAGDDGASETAAALQRALAADTFESMDGGRWSDVRAFYQLRNNAPAWTSPASAAAALMTLGSGSAHGLPADTYGEPGLRQEHEGLSARNTDGDARFARAAAFDIHVTAALLSFGRDIAAGRPRPELAGREWKSRRQVPDLVKTLADAANHDVARWPEAIRPPHPEYAALEKALSALRGQQQKGGWVTVEAKSLAPGKSHPAVVALRHRLAASGELPAATGSSESHMYDEAVAAAVRAFQFHHGLNQTGIADAATLAAINVPVETRIHQVELNLERWRRMPDDFGDRHIFVNIPSYRVVARESGKPVLELKAVVGKPGNETPIFSSDMTTVVFSPYWNIPDSILAKETAPAIARDPNYLARNSLEVLRARGKGGARAVDPFAVDWTNPSEVRQLVVRQRPGPRNALGHVKFLLPNSYDVYLHDTPSVRLFSRGNRAFSHGCVRVDDPEKLAQYVLRGDDSWDETRIDRAMQSGTEQQVKLPESIPVHLVYFTAWVDDGGGLHFAPDIYKYDGPQREPNRTRESARNTRP